MNALTPQEFVQRWENTPLRERQSYQIHFGEVCDMLGFARPSGSGTDENGHAFVFDYGLKKESGKQGFADVFYEGRFGIEYKGADKEHKDLKDAYQQLLQYREKMKNPPLLIVCDIQHWEIHTNWPNTEKRIYKFTNQQILEPSIRRILRAAFDEPNQLHPERNTTQVTTDAAIAFKAIVDNMRNEWNAAPETIAHFLTKLVFSLFAEDIGLLPTTTDGKGLFTEIVDQTRHDSTKFRQYMNQLFEAMRDGGSMLLRDIPYFNGALFKDVNVAALSINALNELDRACHLNWSAVEPAIFGTLFERTLDPKKRAQLGLHYTKPSDIELILEPVLMQPLRREWEAVQTQAAPLKSAYDAALAGGTIREQTERAAALESLRDGMLKRLRTITVLDPACGSGNFLYMALRSLMTLEKEVIKDALWEDLPEAEPKVHPSQMYGIEKDEIAHDLASIVVWIGYLQWREENGYLPNKRPILQDLSNQFQRMDAVMNPDGTEPEWPEVDVIIGNPPFLGGKRMRGELGNEYVDSLFRLYNNRIPHGADLVTYWHEKARNQLEKSCVKRVGLLSTNSIRQSSNREVLNRINQTGNIFMAWSDRDWVLNGAAVRISVVGFDNGDEKDRTLNGKSVTSINSDLTSDLDLTVARSLSENLNISSRGFEPGGPFILDDTDAKQLLAKSGNNKEIILPIVNADDITGRSRNKWVIDFDQTPDIAPENYQSAFTYLKKSWENSLSSSDKRKAIFRDDWWKFRRSGEKVRVLIQNRTRYICTPVTSKHRFFIWLENPILPTNLLTIIAREDDYFFGVLHSRLHEVWSLRMGTWLGVGNDPRYTPTTTFETFPFPWSPGQEDVSSEAYKAIASAAKQLDAERAAWLNPSGLSANALRERTLTNLYNALNVWRGKDAMRVKDAAADFAPRLADLHDALDKAVCAAYGWPESVLGDDEEILRRLLELNLQRAGG